VKIVLGLGAAPSREAKGAGSVAVTLGEKSGRVVVVMVPYGSEAEAAGIEPGDEITTVDGHEVHTLEMARRRLTGPLNEDVLVGLKRDDAVSGAQSWLLRVRRERVRR
jgi:C-terminal processing protease CtpA/Prc